MQKFSFNPIADKNAKILILGTMPGEQSIALNEYYGHKQNIFWKLLFTVFEIPFSHHYEDRQLLLLKNNMALWDVLQTCERKGSLDSAIKKEIPNDFDAFFKTHQDINHIFFNGQKAASFFKKYVVLKTPIPITILPSTSPANAGKTFEQKLAEWSIIKNSIS